MKEVNFTSNNYNDYNANLFFKAYGLENVKFTRKDVEMKNGAKVALVHMSASNPNDGQRIALDIWPNRSQTLDDLKDMPDNIQDIIIRFGLYKDEETGEVVEAAAPKCVGYFVGTDEFTWHGARRDFVDGSSVYSNEPAED